MVAPSLQIRGDASVLQAQKDVDGTEYGFVQTKTSLACPVEEW